MQFVSLNLDLDDVSIVRQAFSRSMDACACSTVGAGKQCAACATLDGLIQELERMTRRATGAAVPRSIPIPASLSCAGDPRGAGFGPVASLPIGLRVVRGGLCDD
jgi:hypothetical protein